MVIVIISLIVIIFIVIIGIIIIIIIIIIITVTIVIDIASATDSRVSFKVRPLPHLRSSPGSPSASASRGASQPAREDRGAQ